jgi:protein SCO1
MNHISTVKFNSEGRVALLFFLLLLMSFFANASHGDPGAYDGKKPLESSDVTPGQLVGVGIDEKLGEKLDLNLKFTNEAGETVNLGSFYDGHHPVMISLVYYSCPGLCNFHLNGVVDGLKEIPWTPGDQFTMLAISFDAKETAALATAKKKTYMNLYGRPEAEKGWHFLTGNEESIKAITKSVGFKYRWDEKQKEWAHASAAIVTTPTGVISRYLGGIQFDPKDIKLALNEASNGKIGTFVDKVLLFCFHYDPKANTYGLYAFNLVRMGGVVILLVMLIWLLPFWFKSKKDEGTVRS